MAPETKLPLIIEDIQDAYKWVIEMGPKLFHTDPEKIAIIGHSAGGYLTLVAGFSVFRGPEHWFLFMGMVILLVIGVGNQILFTVNSL